MRNHSKTFSCILLLLLGFSCNTTQEKAQPSSFNSDAETEYPIHIDLAKHKEKDFLNVSEFADSILYIPLETTPESLIKEIVSIWLNDSIVIIAHKFGLLKFDINGKFIKKIGTQGKGPGEYVSIFDFTVIRDTIYLSPTDGRRFLRYTLDGLYCDKIELKTQPVLFNTTDDQKLAIFERDKGEIYIYNKNIQSPPDTITIEYGINGFWHSRTLTDEKLYNCFYKTSTGLLFNNYLNDTIWNINSKSKEPAFILDTNNKLLPWGKYIDFCTTDNVYEWGKSAKRYFTFNLLPITSGVFIFQKAWFRDEYLDENYNTYQYDALLFLEKKTNKLTKYNYIYDDITGNQKLTWLYQTRYKSYLIGDIYPYNLLSNLEQNRRNGNFISPTFLDQIKNLKEDDNPVLVLIKTKEN